jgi:glycosyltransferase involved in cell wall biosynthesis
MVGRRFWPHGGYVEAIRLTKLAADLSRRGIHVEVVTPQYSATWSQRFRLGDLTIHRPLLAPKSDWTIARYTRHLTQWLRGKCQSFDAVFVDSIREEAIAAIEATRVANLGLKQSSKRGNLCSTILRLGGTGDASDDQWWTSNRASRRCAVIGRMADHVVVSDAAQSRTLLSHDYDAAKIHRIESGIENGPARTAAAVTAARKSLAAANSDLLTDTQSFVLLATARMSRGSGIFTLVQAARLLVTKHPSLQIWLVGDGPSRDKVYSTLRSDGIRAHIAMPGSFCQLDDLLMASDVYLHCGQRCDDSILPQAIGSGLPSLVCESDSNRSWLGLPESTHDQEHQNHPDGVWWYDGEKEHDLRRGVHDLLRDPSASLQRAETLKRKLLKRRPISQTLDQYESLVRTCCQRGRSGMAADCDAETGGENRGATG